MELSLLCDVRVFLFIYDNHQHQNHTNNGGGGNGHHADPKLIHYQSDPRDDLKLIFKQNCNRIFFSNENVSKSEEKFSGCVPEPSYLFVQRFFTLPSYDDDQLSTKSLIINTWSSLIKYASLILTRLI